MFLCVQRLQDRDWIQIRLRYDSIEASSLGGAPADVIDADALRILLGVRARDEPRGGCGGAQRTGRQYDELRPRRDHRADHRRRRGLLPEEVD